MKRKKPSAHHEKQNQMEALIIQSFQEHRRRYGVRRLVAELKAEGRQIGKHRVQGVLRHNGLKAIQPRSFVPRTTQSRHPYPISPNLLLEYGTVTKPNEVWVGDITFIPLTGGGFLYLAVWMDLYSRRIVGWHLEVHMQEALVVEALKTAFKTRAIGKGMIVHSDQGGQYAGGTFRKLLDKNGVRQSMSRADNVYDNAFMEALFSRFKAELLEGGAFQSKEDAQTEIFEYIEMYYNPKRRHSALNYQSPVNYENHYYHSLT
ncbi:MAG: IS3 family transposase [Nitrososphaera sp.]|nr:IS3 family transposase [Nitrososphaera sp.]